MNGLLKKTVELAKTGSGDGYEDFYILTVDNTYGKIRLYGLPDEESEAVLADVYTALYRHVHDLPLEEEMLDAMMEAEVQKALEKRLGEVPEKAPMIGDPVKLAAMGIRVLLALLSLFLIAAVFYMLWRYMVR